ncbi:MAG: NUDIX hydrolase [Holosporales bacterium]|nr:NUDIX hydrolase [Holosporales bacterium]
MLDFIAKELNCFDNSCESGHFTGSCWLESFDGKAALLTHHKKYGEWFQLGGHADGNPDLLSVALREAREESGFSKIELVQAGIFDIGVHPNLPEDKGFPVHYHYDVRFYLRAAKDEPFIVSEESFSLKWIYKNEEDKIPNNYDVKRMFKKWKNMQP